MRVPLFRLLLFVAGLVLSLFSTGQTAVFAQVGKDAPEAAPGLHIPSTVVPWALDEYDGTAVLVPIHHATTKLNRHSGKNFAGSLTESFLYRPVVTNDLPGQHAKVQIHSQRPVFYRHADIDEDPDGEDNGDKSSFVIVPAKIVNDHRELTQINFNQFTSHAKRKDTGLATQTEKLPHGWLRITTHAPLTQGEYALLRQPERADLFQNTVFPFAIDEKPRGQPKLYLMIRKSSESML